MCRWKGLAVERGRGKGPVARVLERGRGEGPVARPVARVLERGREKGLVAGEQLFGREHHGLRLSHSQSHHLHVNLPAQVRVWCGVLKTFESVGWYGHRR